jgi:hypothetical protein
MEVQAVNHVMFVAIIGKMVFFPEIKEFSKTTWFCLHFEFFQFFTIPMLSMS